MSEDFSFFFFFLSCFVCLIVLVKEHRVVYTEWRPVVNTGLWSRCLEGLGVGTCASRGMKCLCVMQKVGRPLCKSISIHLQTPFVGASAVFIKQYWFFFHSETYLIVRYEHFRKVDNQESKQKILVTFPSIRSRVQCGPEMIRSYWTAVFLPAHKPAGALHPLLRKNSL